MTRLMTRNINKYQTISDITTSQILEIIIITVFTLSTLAFKTGPSPDR